MKLNFQMQKQILGNWCWAAVTSSISFHYLHGQSKWRQSVLAAHFFGDQCALITPGNAPAAPAVCDTVLDVSVPLQLTDNFAGEISRALSFNEVVVQINKGRPICCQFLWPGFIASHFVVVFGYDETNVIIGDPQAGVFSIEFNQFVSNYREGGVWQRSIGTRPPLS